MPHEFTYEQGLKVGEIEYVWRGMSWEIWKII